MNRIAGSVLVSLAAIIMGGCSTLGYYAEIVDGHLSLQSARTPISELLDDARVDPVLKKRLRTAQQIRDYASEVLQLPDNDSYRSYADIERDFVTWNVVATPRFSLKAETWCFWVAGCVAYRGFYSKASAQALAGSVREQGYDVAISGARAYSTLGWFDDPVLNTMITGEDFTLAGLLFHELAHQKLYVEDSSAFNEAFATFVEREGVRRWLDSRNADAEKLRHKQKIQRQADFISLLKRARDNLSQLYKQEQPQNALQLGKKAVFAQLQTDYRELKKTWGGYNGYDRWFARPLNNAHLATLSTYHRWVPGFARLYQQSGDLATFYLSAAEIGELPAAQRREKLDALSND